MNNKTISTRRSFIRTAGAAVSVPLAAAVPALAARDVEDPLSVRLELLEHVDAIRAGNQAFARSINSGQHTIGGNIVRVAANGFGEQDMIEIAADRATATAFMHCTVETEKAIEPSCPLVEMAREQGGGVVRHAEQVVFEHAYVRRDGTWKIERSTFRPA